MGGFGLQLGDGLDVQTIVEQLLFVEAQPIRNLQGQEDGIQRKIDAFNDLRSRLTELASKLSVLNSSGNFAARQALSSNPDVLGAGADSSAAPGTYNITVNRLALIDNFVADATFADSDAQIGTGSFDLSVGGETVTITIDSSNNSLTGLRDAINGSGVGARAAIVNDGSGYRLTITSNDSGAENAISISNNTLQQADSSALTFSRTHNIASVDELDAELVVNGLTVTSGSNSVSGVIEGVTLSLNGVSPAGSSVSLTISNDTDSVRQAIEEFVAAYNEAVGFINSQFAVSGSSGQTGALAGESLLRRIQSDLGSIVRSSISGGPEGLFSLRAAGIELQNDGSLQINESALADKLESNFEDFQQLFLAFATATGSGLSLVNVGSSAEAGSYEVNITQAAAAAQVTSQNAIGAQLGVDETLTFTQGSLTSIVSLSSTDDISTILSKLNAQFEADGIGLVASQSGSNLVISATGKGSSGSFTVVSDVDGLGTGFGTSGQAGTGLDVAGTFTDLATSTVYSASGVGEILTGVDGNAKGLAVRYSGASTGTVGTLDVSLGFAAQLERVLDGLTDSIDGPIHQTVERLNTRIRDIDDHIASLEDRLELRRQFLLREFARADQALRQLSNLQAQLGAAGSSSLF